MRYLKKIEKYPLDQQIEMLRQRLDVSNDTDEILAFKKAIREKSRQLQEQTAVKKDTVQGLIQRLELLAMDDDKVYEVRLLYEEIRDNYYNDLSDKDLARLQKLFGIIQEKMPSQSSKVNAKTDQDIGALLTRLQFLITDGNSVEARKVADVLRDQLYFNMKKQEAERFNKLLGDLRGQEDLEAKVLELEEKNCMLEQQMSQYVVRLEEMADKLAQLEPLAHNASFFKKLACVILAHDFKSNPASVLSHKHLNVCLQEDQEEGTYGYNENLIVNIFNTILKHFDTIIQPYKRLLEEET